MLILMLTLMLMLISTVVNGRKGDDIAVVSSLSENPAGVSEVKYVNTWWRAYLIIDINNKRLPDKRKKKK